MSLGFPSRTQGPASARFISQGCKGQFKHNSRPSHALGRGLLSTLPRSATCLAASTPCMPTSIQLRHMSASSLLSCTSETCSTRPAAAPSRQHCKFLSPNLYLAQQKGWGGGVTACISLCNACSLTPALAQSGSGGLLRPSCVSCVARVDTRSTTPHESCPRTSAW